MTGEVVADRDHVTARRLLEEQGVEGDDLVDVGRREVEQTGHVLLDLERDVAEGLLGQPQHGKERAALVRVESLQPPHFGELVGSERGTSGVRHIHRSWPAGWL